MKLLIDKIGMPGECSRVIVNLDNISMLTGIPMTLGTKGICSESTLEDSCCI